MSGGHTGDGASATVEMLDMLSATSKWKESAPMHEKRSGHGMIPFKDEIFVIGGHNGKNRVASCEKFVKHFCSV